MTGIYLNYFLLPSLFSLNGNRHSLFWLPHRNFRGFLRSVDGSISNNFCGNVLFLSPDYVNFNDNFVLLFRNVLAYFTCKQVD